MIYMSEILLVEIKCWNLHMRICHIDGQNANALYFSMIIFAGRHLFYARFFGEGKYTKPEAATCQRPVEFVGQTLA